MVVPELAKDDGKVFTIKGVATATVAGIVLVVVIVIVVVAVVVVVVLVKLPQQSTTDY